MLVRQALYHFGHTPVLFALASFQVESQAVCPGLVLDSDLPTYASGVAGITGTCHTPIILVVMGFLLTFCLYWPQIAILLISAHE
jgi:hypothetical protein